MKTKSEIKLKIPRIRYKKFPHKVFINYDEQTKEDCDGKVYWEEGLEGYVCTKCNLYTGVK